MDPPGTTPTDRQSYGSPMGRVWARLDSILVAGGLIDFIRATVGGGQQDAATLRLIAAMQLRRTGGAPACV